MVNVSKMLSFLQCFLEIVFDLIRYFLAKNPSIMQKLQQEVDEELKGSPVTLDCFSKLRHCKNAFMVCTLMEPVQVGK